MIDDNLWLASTVEDLDLPPAFSITPETNIEHALEQSYERSYSYLPVVSSKNRSLLGYLSAEQLQKLFSSRDAPVPKKPHADVGFSKKNAFKIITPDTPLEELEAFFANGHDFAVVTDDSRRFVLGIATLGDLDNFIKRRPSITEDAK
ncbi:hypothetical protein V1514DRAFT_345745 [Lipomyces japonicus]|uniref:uncharacterized protein n=1 Tax=Lipomyces japonicus TaxID=56871 RepID=UPI0034CFD2E0